MFQLFGFTLKIVCVVGLTVGVVACSSNPALEAINAGQTSNTTTRIVPENLVYNVNLGREFIARDIYNMAYQFKKEFGGNVVRPGSGRTIAIETINPNAASGQPYMVIRVQSPEEGFTPVGVVVRTQDLHVQGYVSNMDTVGSPATYLYYNDATIQAVTGVSANEKLPIASAYINDSTVNLTRVSMVAAFKEVGLRNITNNTIVQIAPLLTESIRFGEVRTNVLQVMQNATSSLNFSALRDNYFKNWSALSIEMYSLLAFPDPNAVQLQRIIKLTSIIFLGTLGTIVNDTVN
jgi:hypothetical protein